MAIIQPDLSEVNKPIDPGTYAGKITAVDFKTSKANNPMIVVKFDVDVNGKNKVRSAHLVITGETAFGFEQLLRATHFGDVANSLKKGGKPFDTDQLVGQELQLVIDSDTYNGQLTDRIKSFLPA